MKMKLNKKLLFKIFKQIIQTSKTVSYLKKMKYITFNTDLMKT